MDSDYKQQLINFTEQKIKFNQHLGLKVEHIEPGSARLYLPYQDHFVGDPFRPALHGGVISFLVDTCGGIAVFTKLTPKDRCSTVDLRVDYLRPAELADLYAEAKVVRAGNRVAVTNVWVTQPGSAEPIAEGKAVYNLKRS